MYFLLVICAFLTNFFVNGDFAERLLEQHNELRATHNTPPLKLDDDLTKKANDIVRKAAKDGEFFDGKDLSPPGVNTMMVCASFKRKEDSAKDVASSWLVLVDYIFIIKIFCNKQTQIGKTMLFQNAHMYYFPHKMLRL